MRVQARQRGFTLVEILVVTVILVLGIFTIVRVFPLGFNLLRTTEEYSAAKRLAQAEIERLKESSATLPEAIVAVHPTAGIIDPTVRPDLLEPSSLLLSPEEKQALLQRPDADLWTDINQSRKIVGETLRIPAPSITDFGPASVYSLNFAPIEWPNTAVVSPQEADRYLLVRSTNLNRVDVTDRAGPERREALENLGFRSYGIDYKLGFLYFNPAPFPREYVVEYVPRGTGRAITEVVRVPATSLGPMVGVPLRRVFGSGGAGQPVIEPETDRVARKYRYIPQDQPFSPDPFEYKVLSRYPSGIQFAATLGFNPRAFEGFGRGPLTARIDYMVADWHILHEDRILPERPPYRVRLGFSFLQKAGETQQEESFALWPGLLRDRKVPLSVIAIHLGEGLLTYDTDYPGGTIKVDYKNGVLEFQPGNWFSPSGNTLSMNPAGFPVRIFYKVEGDWGIAIQKSAERYVPVSPSRILGIGTYLPLPVLPPSQSRDSLYHLRALFPIADEGKSVVVDYVYWYWDKKGVLHRQVEQGVNARISELSEPGGGIPPIVNAPPHPYIDIPIPLREDPNMDLRRGIGVKITQVRGTFLRALVVWREGDRWRRQEVVTFLTRREETL